MPIATAYRLLYQMRGPAGPLFDGGDVELHLRLHADAAASEAAIAELGGIVTAFEHLAWTGALSGGHLAPWLSGIGVVEQLAAAGDHLVWRFEECRFDDRAAVILAQMFLLSQARAPLSEIAFVKPGTGAPLHVLAEDPNIADPYPGAFRLGPNLPAIDDAASSDITLLARFDRVLSVGDAEAIDTALMTWAAVAAMGAYGNAPVPPEQCGLSPPRRAEVHGGEVEFSLARVRAHPGALDGLSNAALAFHQSIAPIVELRIE